LEDKWKAWRVEIEKVRAKEREERQKKFDEQERKRIAYELKEAERRAKWDARTRPLKEGFAKMWASIRNAFTYEGDWKVIIRRTKQITGAFITLILLVAAYFVVNGLAFILTGFVDFSIEYWYIYAEIAAFAAVIGILYVIYILITGWAQNVVNKYKGGRKIWYMSLSYILFGIR
jgi:hypothetical protein